MLNSPQNDEELALLREKVAVAQQIEEIKELITLRNELDMVKKTLQVEPILAQTQLKEEISHLREQVILLQSVRQLAVDVSRVPPHASLQVSNPNIFHIERQSHTQPPYFAVDGKYLIVLFAGYYQFMAYFIHRGYLSSSVSYHLYVNDILFRKIGQEEGGQSLLIASLMLNRNDRLSVHSEDSYKPNQSSLSSLIEIPTAVEAKVEIFMIQGHS
jgi:hypothetical protein